LLFGNYIGSVFDITYTFTHAIPASATLLDGWVRNSTSEGYGNTVTGTLILPQPNGSVEVSINETTAQIRTRLYKVTHSFLGADISDVWIPEPPEDIFFNYSLHIFDHLATKLESETDDSKGFIVYPNPATDHITLISNSDISVGNYNIYTLEGKVVKTNKHYGLNAINSIDIDVSHLINGIYIIRFTNSESSSAVQFIIAINTLNPL